MKAEYEPYTGELIEAPQTIIRDHMDWPSSFPFMVSTTEGVSPGFQRMHWHHALEINYIRRGHGFYLINGIKYNFVEGDILLINAHDLHRAFENEDLMMDVFLFDPALLAVDLRYDPELLRPFRDIGIHFTNLLDRNADTIPELVQLLQRIKGEMDNKDISHIPLVRALLTEFLVLVNRNFAVQHTGPAPMKHRGMLALKEVIRTMEQNLSFPWTLKQLADLAHLSPSRFSALFQLAVGTSPLDYLIQLRLIHAVHLLESTDLKIIQIAADCGFRNLSNFNRLFKQQVGKSPSELRHQQGGTDGMI
ncbi:helix-turn-helix transcriptional regulator [Paenibacillus sp. 481]|nr:helix-turn-helix transcriptional regulator [Paenibacillus sp. 481]